MGAACVAAPESRRTYATNVASQWQLMWRKFRRHHMAPVGGGVLLLLYLATSVAGFLSSYEKATRDAVNLLAPPQRVRPFHDGRLIGPSSTRSSGPATRRLCCTVMTFMFLGDGLRDAAGPYQVAVTDVARRTRFRGQCIGRPVSATALGRPRWGRGRHDVVRRRLVGFVGSSDLTRRFVSASLWLFPMRRMLT